jgi:threonine aldolase
MTIDLRSDTVTRPTPKMLKAMFEAKVGDDVYDEDFTVKELEQKTAQMFGIESGLFCPSGTMANQIGIRCLTQPNNEIICDKLSHIYHYEGGGLASNSLLSVRLVDGNRGRMTPEQVLENINPDNIHYPSTTLVSLENTVNKAGGSVYTLSEIESISKVCKENQLSLHLDGARLWNALVTTGEPAHEYGKYFDSISVCFSKGLGCPVGSVLLGSKETIRKAKRIRKIMGGGWRQAGYLAAACLYALQNNIKRLEIDHQNAKKIAKKLKNCSFVAEILPVETNILIFEVKKPFSVEEIVQKFAKNNILLSGFGKNHIRMVTHLDFTQEMLEILISKLENSLAD